MTEPMSQVTCREYFLRFGMFLRYASEQTDTLIAILHSPTEGEVIIMD